MSRTTLELTQPLAGAPAARWPRAQALPGVQTLEITIMLGLTAAAALVRWPEYLYTPGFTDEILEVYQAVLIYTGRALPLTNYDVYDGPLFNYLLAGLFALFGPELYLPRLLALVVGCLTVPAAYLLGREWGGRAAGLLAAAVLIANPVHVLVNSHIAWSNCLTPFFTTLGLWQLTRAARRHDTAALAWAGLLLGLALQTHPSVLCVLPAVALYFLWSWRRELRLAMLRPLVLTAALFLLGCGPLVANSLIHSSDTVHAVLYTGSRDKDEGGFALETYAANVGNFALLLVRTTAGLIDDRANLGAYLLDPTVLPWLALGLAAALVLARRGNPLLLFLLPSTVLVAAVFRPSSFDPIAPGRYVMPTAIVVMAAVATLLALAARLIPGPPALRPAIVAVVGLALAVPSLAASVTYVEPRAIDNRAYFQAVAAVESARQPGETVVFDEKLSARALGAWMRVNRIVKYNLVIRGIDLEETAVGPDNVEALLAARASALMILAPDNAVALSGRWSVVPLATFGPGPARPDARESVPSWRGSPLWSLLRRPSGGKDPGARERNDFPRLTIARVSR